MPTTRRLKESNDLFQVLKWQSGGNKVAFLGDSITNGSASSNASVDSFQAVVSKLLGGAFVLPWGQSINAGVPSDTSTLALARMDSIIAQNPAAIWVQIGTNDSSVGIATPIATYISNIIAMHRKALAAGIPIGFGQIPPKGSGAPAADQLLIRQYNLFLASYCRSNNLPFAEVFNALVDSTTGFLNASLHSDGTHPNNAGHLLMAQTIAPQLRKMIQPMLWPPLMGVTPDFGLISDPFVTNVANYPLLVGTATSRTSVAPTDGDGLPAGNWLALRKDNSVSGSSSTYAGPLLNASGFAAGEVLLVCCYIKANSPASDGFGLLVRMLQSGVNQGGITADVKTNAPGPVMAKYTVPTGVTSLHLGLGSAPGAGLDITTFMGCCQVFNLTRAGLVDYF
jgi:lysophospholipase L1-like esterase